MTVDDCPIKSFIYRWFSWIFPCHLWLPEGNCRVPRQPLPCRHCLRRKKRRVQPEERCGAQRSCSTAGPGAPGGIPWNPSIFSRKNAVVKPIRGPSKLSRLAQAEKSLAPLGWHLDPKCPRLPSKWCAHLTFRHGVPAEFISICNTELESSLLVSLRFSMLSQDNSLWISLDFHLRFTRG